MTAYCDLLAEKPIQALNPRTPLELVHEDKLVDDDDSDVTLVPEQAPTEKNNAYFSKGWGSFLMSGVAQWSRKPLGESRVPKAVLIPTAVMTHWRTVADSMNVRVSRNDLLMAWLYMVGTPSLPYQLLHC